MLTRIAEEYTKLQAAGLVNVPATAAADEYDLAIAAGNRRLRKRGAGKDDSTAAAAASRKKVVPPENILHYKLGSRRREKLVETLLGRYVPDSSSEAGTDEDDLNGTVRYAPGCVFVCVVGDTSCLDERHLGGLASLGYLVVWGGGIVGHRLLYCCGWIVLSQRLLSHHNL